MFYGHFCAHGRLNELSKVKDETPFRYAPCQYSNSGGSDLICGSM